MLLFLIGHIWITLHKVIFDRNAGGWKLLEGTKMADGSEKESVKEKSSEKPVIPRTATEIQKRKLEKLMKDPVSRDWQKKKSLISRTNRSPKERK